jgi:hypothetical protein
MKKNMSHTDRLVRAVVGLFIVLLGVQFGCWLGAIGLIPVLTAVTGFCPMYIVLGINTCGTCVQSVKPGKLGERMP